MSLQSGGRSVEEAKAIKVESLAELARLAGTYVVMGQPVYIIRFPFNGKHYCGMIMILRDYYKFYGIPLFYYTECEKKGKYLVFKSDSEGEAFELGEKQRPGWLSIAIIDLKEKPPFLGELK